MFPDEVCRSSVESEFAIEEAPYATWCLLDFVRAFFDQFLRKFFQTAFVSNYTSLTCCD